MCHGPDGDGRGSLASTFTRPVPSLVDGPFAWTIAGENQELRTARIIKFGIPGTDMAGHEVMRDEQVNALVAEVLRLRKK
jgi:cytochrome c oxidase cbb3-type subunit 2